MASLRAWWDRYRHFRAAQGLASDLLDFLGWKQMALAIGLAIITWLRARIAHLAGVERVVIALVVFTCVLVISNIGLPYLPNLCRRTSRPHPTTPILRCNGTGYLNLGELIVYTAAVGNVQHET